jgi:hypothetical protein
MKESRQTAIGCEVCSGMIGYCSDCSKTINVHRGPVTSKLSTPLIVRHEHKINGWWVRYGGIGCIQWFETNAPLMLPTKMHIYDKMKAIRKLKRSES